MIDKELILIRIIDRSQIKELKDELLDRHVECRGKVLSNDIVTKSVIIRCVNIPIVVRHAEYVKGMRAAGCFGFEKDAEDYITRGNNVCDGYELLEYIDEMNKI